MLVKFILKQKENNQYKRVRVVCVSDKWLLVLETVEEILEKIEKIK